MCTMATCYDSGQLTCDIIGMMQGCQQLGISSQGALSTPPPHPPPKTNKKKREEEINIHILACLYESKANTNLTAACLLSVSEIKGAPCTRRAQFHGRVHDFRRCAPGVCTFFEPFIILIYWEGAWSNFWVHSLMGSAPCECTKEKLNFGHCYYVWYNYHIKISRRPWTWYTR